VEDAVPDYLPPCFWTSAAFAERPTKIVHRHPFRKWKDKKKIAGKLSAQAVFTWPFRLAMTHSQDTSKRNGTYFADLETRIERYCNRLIPGTSLVFFYLNYDNPISADEYKYAVVGCARLADLGVTGHFSFTSEELRKIRSGDGMNNFPNEHVPYSLSSARRPSCNSAEPTPPAAP